MAAENASRTNIPLEYDFTGRSTNSPMPANASMSGKRAYGPGVLDIYRRAHVFVHVSLTEGLPQVLIEALASGTVLTAWINPPQPGDIAYIYDDGTELGKLQAGFNEMVAGLRERGVPHVWALADAPRVRRA